MKKYVSFFFIFLFLPGLWLAQEVGSGVNLPAKGALSFQLNYPQFSPNFIIDGIEENVTREIL